MPPGLLERCSHELRTSLTGITGYAEFLENDSVQPMVKFTANIINENSLHLTRTSNAFFDFQYLLQNKIILYFVYFIYSDLLINVFLKSKFHAKTRNINIDLSFSSPLKNLYVYSDVDRHRCLLDGLIYELINISNSNDFIKINLSHDELENFLVLSFDFHISNKFVNQELLFFNFWNDPIYSFKLQEGPGVESAYIKKLLYFLNGSSCYRVNPGSFSQLIIHLPLNSSVSH